MTMSNALMLHCGGWKATQADLDSVPVPEETESYFPVPYGRFVEEIKLHVPRFGLRLQDESFALAREGKQMFGVLTCTNGRPEGGYALAVGLRNSYDRSLSVGLVAGTRVFCCDNLAFTGEVAMARRHTTNVFRDLPDLVYRMLSRVKRLEERQEAEIGAMKRRELGPRDADHLLVEGVRRHVVPASHLPQVMRAWEKPRYPEFAPRTAWSLLNAFTEVTKSRSPRAQIEGTLRLIRMFREKLSLTGKAAGNGA
jgi:hypothetical protein